MFIQKKARDVVEGDVILVKGDPQTISRTEGNMALVWTDLSVPWGENSYGCGADDMITVVVPDPQ